MPFTDYTANEDHLEITDALMFREPLAPRLMENLHHRNFKREKGGFPALKADEALPPYEGLLRPPAGSVSPADPASSSAFRPPGFGPMMRAGP